jgi:hypothetical protein
MQRGRIYEASGQFYVQYRVNGKQVSRFLCEKSAAYYTRTCKAVKLKTAEVMLEVNKSAGVVPPMADMPVNDFYEKCFLAYCQEITAHSRPRLKPSTLLGWRSIWTRYLKPHFGDATLKSYTAAQGKLFLDGLTAKLPQQSLRHIKNLASLIFKRAVDEPRIPSNPWRDVNIPKSAIKKPPTPCYTLKKRAHLFKLSKVIRIASSSLLSPASSDFGPMRLWPFGGKILTAIWLHIRRGMVRGKLDVPKSDSSLKAVPLPMEIREQLHFALRRSCSSAIADNSSALHLPVVRQTSCFRSKALSDML